MSNNMKLIDAIMNGDAITAREEFTAAINDKVNTVLDIRRVTMASDVFNQVQEAASIKKEILNPNVVKDLPESETYAKAVDAYKVAIKVRDEAEDRYDKAANKYKIKHSAVSFNPTGGSDSEKAALDKLRDEMEKANDAVKVAKKAKNAISEDVEDLDEAVKLRSKVIITKGPKDVEGKTGFVGEINKGLHKGDESYVIDVQGGGHITLRRGSFKLAAKDKVNEEDLDKAKTPGQKFDMDKVNAVQ